MFNRGCSDLTRQLRLAIEGKRVSWFMKFQYCCYKENKLCIYSVNSKVNNIGTGGLGKYFTHKTQTFDVNLDSNLSSTRMHKINVVDHLIGNNYLNFFSLKKRIYRRLKDLMYF